MSVLDVLRRRNRPANDILHTQVPHPRARSSPWKPGDAHHPGVYLPQRILPCHPCAKRTSLGPCHQSHSGAALQLSGATEGKGGGIEGADARQSASRSTAPRRTHAQTTSSCWNPLAPAAEASRPPTVSVYRIKQELDADGGSAVVGDAIAIGGLGLRPPRRRLAGSACWTHASLLD
jgi:hypothetical protein